MSAVDDTAVERLLIKQPLWAHHQGSFPPHITDTLFKLAQSRHINLQALTAASTAAQGAELEEGLVHFSICLTEGMKKVIIFYVLQKN